MAWASLFGAARAAADFSAPGGAADFKMRPLLDLQAGAGEGPARAGGDELVVADGADVSGDESQFSIISARFNNDHIKVAVAEKYLERSSNILRQAVSPALPSGISALLDKRAKLALGSRVLRASSLDQCFGREEIESAGLDCAARALAGDRGFGEIAPTVNEFNKVGAQLSSLSRGPLHAAWPARALRGALLPPNASKLTWATCDFGIRFPRRSSSGMSPNEDGVPQRLRALGGAGPALAAGAPAGPPAPRSAWGPQVAGPGGGWQWASPSGAGDAPGTSALAQLTGQVRARAGVLCLVLVHSCSELLGVRFAGAAAPAPGGDLRGGGAGLQFAGSAERFQVLLLLTELSLHLLHAHLGALCAAASAGGAAVAAAAASVTAPPPGVPRRALVVRCLRALRQLSCLAGGAVALEADEDPTIAPGRSSRKVLDLSFAASVAEGVEELMEGLQVL
ncbi:unnamed protein product [Prorocentrum cordatum]|uniref:Spindle pole body component n=1 Tax=Prorocentrum cordatum TaxID=2364126 RepID=A0ABN9PYA5_9DINO|nr:unnamed protein product [Polarella glacialis]